jgi:hypothetical protein
MKILSLLSFALVISFSVFAQISSDTTNSNRNKNGYSQPGNHQYYQMQDGKLVMYSHDVKNDVIKDVTLPNGTTITTTGKVTWKNGKTHTLQEGESIGMNGKIYNGNTNNHPMIDNADSSKQ